YDAAVTGRAVELATRLQLQHAETISAGEIEALGAEVGLQPAFVQQALAQLASEQTAKTSTAVAQKPRFVPSELWSQIAAFGIPFLWAAVSYNLEIANHFFSGPSPPVIMGPVPLSLLVGYIAGRKK